jgi:hypothetical protein
VKNRQAGYKKRHKFRSNYPGNKERGVKSGKVNCHETRKLKKEFDEFR